MGRKKMFEEGIYQEIKNVTEICDDCQEKITAIGALAIPVLIYSFGIIKRRSEEIKKIDRKTKRY
jgi:hypothetical protein